MKKISKDQFFVDYPKYSNFEELTKAEILVMPYYRDVFKTDQDIFRDISSDYKINCLFYSEDQNVLWHFHEHAISTDQILQLGSAVITTFGAIIELYKLLKDRTEGKKFRITHVLSIKNFYYEMDEFEGTIDDYRAVNQELESKYQTLQKK